MNSTVVIIGGGAIGKLIARTFAREASVTIVDHQPIDPIDGVEFVQGEASELDLALVRKFDWVCLCLPESVALNALKQISCVLRSDQLLVDTLSVKTEYFELLNELEPASEILSINPLFAPDLGWQGNNLVYLSRTPARHTELFLQKVESLGAVMTELQPDQHDKTMASLQCATHVATLAFALTLAQSGYDASVTKNLWTPPHKMLLSMVARMGELDSEVYRDIQHGNPRAADTREMFVESIKRVAISCDSPKAFADLLTEAQSILGGSSAELRELFQKTSKQ